MTLAASLSSRTHSVWNRRIIGSEVDVKANGSDLFLTAGVTIVGETAKSPDVDLCAEDEQVSGIIVGQADDATDLDKDSDDTFDDNTNLKMGIPIPSEEMYLTTITNSTVTFGKIVHCVGGFFEDTDFDAAQTSANIPYASSMMFQAQETITPASGVEAIFLGKRV